MTWRISALGHHSSIDVSRFCSLSIVLKAAPPEASCAGVSKRFLQPRNCLWLGSGEAFKLQVFLNRFRRFTNLLVDERQVVLVPGSLGSNAILDVANCTASSYRWAR